MSLIITHAEGKIIPKKRKSCLVSYGQFTRHIKCLIILFGIL